MPRLEQLDPYRLEFGGRVVAQDDGWVRLDRSAFYPASGGQPHDTGELVADGDAWRVVDVVLRGDEVWHRLEGAGSLTLGRRMRGRIDRERRFRHMQRHTAQHLLSQAFLRVRESFGTESVGLGSAEATVDLAGEPDDDAVAEATTAVNEVAARALTVRTIEVDEADIGRYPLRRPPKVRGRIRLVAIGDYEVSACGGTHLRSSAEALPILTLGRERIRGGLTRVTFRAGLEAVREALATQRAAQAAAAGLSSRVADLPQRVEALQEEAAAARRALALVRADLAGTLAAARAADTPLGDAIVVRLPREREGLETPLADALAALGRSALVAIVGDAGVKVVAVSGGGGDVRPALQELLATLGGRGGGRPERAQGAAPHASEEAVDAALAVARKRLVSG
jgi:alanyl-tRNA synthetase